MKKTVRVILYLFFSSMVLGLAALVGYWYYTHQPHKRFKKIPGNIKAMLPHLPLIILGSPPDLKNTPSAWMYLGGKEK